MISIPLDLEDGKCAEFIFDQLPDICPYCGKGIVPIPINGKYQNITEPGLNRNEVQVVFQCPINKCKALFITQYKKLSRKRFHIVRNLRKYSVSPVFNKTINQISPQFLDIFKQSFQAEEMNLIQVAGPGYRKAFEYLVKDYVIKDLKSEEEIEKVKRTFLGNIIDHYIDNPLLKSTSKRAVWLGNDQTHYTQIWADKDINNLKEVIKMTTAWIELVELSKKLEHDMPE
jgi:hypothetical protein